MKNINISSLKNHKNKLLTICGLTLAILISSCEELIKIDPPQDKLIRETVFESDASATAAILNIYGVMCSESNFTGGWIFSLTYLNGLNADELILFASGASEPFYSNNILPSDNTVGSIWGNSYNIIYSANAVIEGLSGSPSITPSLKNQLTGEAMFIRAFCHFYLVNLFGDVPYITTTDYRSNANVTRTSVNMVYESIIQDLLKAEELLQDGYIMTERIRPNKCAAKALLARTYLYSSKWEDAENKASEIISNTLMFSLVNLNSVFLKNSNEAIWQLFPLAGRNNSVEGNLFILNGTPTRSALNEDLIKNFEPGDLRGINWIGSIKVSSNTYYYPYKYKATASQTSSTEYSMVLRLAEQYLIRAEARAYQNKLTGSNSAESDINVLRSRAGLANTVATTQTELLSAIEKEARMELFTEWGHRWFDLKRKGRADVVLSPVKLGWDATDMLWPLPESELLNNKNLTPQNPGY